MRHPISFGVVVANIWVTQKRSGQLKVMPMTIQQKASEDNNTT